MGFFCTVHWYFRTNSKIKQNIKQQQQIISLQNGNDAFFILCTVTVKVKDGQTTATNFKGVLLQARKGSSPDTATYYGTWNVLSSNLKTINCGSGSTVSAKNIHPFTWSILTKIHTCICNWSDCIPTTSNRFI